MNPNPPRPDDLEPAGPETPGPAQQSHVAAAKAERQQAALDLIPESARWNPVPGSSGHQVPDMPNEDEDDANGANESARLVAEGIETAAQEQVKQAGPDPQSPDTSRLD